MGEGDGEIYEAEKSGRKTRVFMSGLEYFFLLGQM